MQKSRYGWVLVGAGLTAGALWTLAGCASTEPTAQGPRAGAQTAQTLQTTERSDGSPAEYLLYLPKGYGADETEEWPLVIFLHGAGERGSNLDLVAVHGPPKLAREGRDFPFILVSPQAPRGEWWSVDYLSALLDEVEEKYRVDPGRIYLTGLSMGGFGTWAWAAEELERFAALAPIAGGGEPATVCALAAVPTWAFHGAQDNVVPVERTREMVEALQACDGDIRYSEYPDAGHDSWTVTYANPAFYDWLLEQRRD